MLLCYNTPRELAHFSKVTELLNVKNYEGSKILPFCLKANELV